MAGRMGTNIGEVSIDNDVIAKVAGYTAIECYGIVGMASINVTNGFARLLKRESLSKGIKVDVYGKNITIDFHVIIEYGINIRAVADNLISNVKYKLEKFTGMEVGKINIYVEGVRVD
ncbi:Asp23/Gls24 family envelope stress response protein [Vallitalea pronyensis]|uniref:Asp23/Gls24 family envelope stress response protein n=1 Tax=Vallitalea pronyensis TaxID=1348613 RepID=A0A8J8SGT7_9FIRM|nr:Asp23/Gls24 family envelope stress response protein [Vallitalea pronyensis]QUI22931.1 Asp23/Gls24 family envelope stress response protein [Vallitalea pronyensis]